MIIPCDKPESRRYSQPLQGTWRTAMAILNFLNLTPAQSGPGRLWRGHSTPPPMKPILPA
ncbi:hypothetical protein [Sphingomonas sp. KC8]|uniref:hypothetical protein n=1 Tax=Sphingomonas sp. KC8 TaxID=1030157 RepID=UPI0012FA6CCD|nr:hypothetical protein [Sphingomonas sp. KC8]